MLNVKKEIAWLDLQLQQGARQLHLQKPCNRWKVQDKSKKTIKPTRTYQTNRKFLKRKKNCCTNTESLDSASLEEIKIAMERTKNTQASQQHARTNQTTLHKQNTCKHNSSTASAAVSASAASASTNLRARKKEKRAMVDLRHDLFCRKRGLIQVKLLKLPLSIG